MIGQQFKSSKVDIHEHETKPPEYFNEGSLLKAMENPQNYIQLDNKNMLKLSNKQVELVLSQHALTSSINCLI